MSLISKASEAPFFFLFSFTCQLPLLFHTCSCEFGGCSNISGSFFAQDFEFWFVFLLILFWSFLCIVHYVKPIPLVAKQRLMALRAVHGERLHHSPGALGLPNPFPHHLFFSCPPPPLLQKTQITPPPPFFFFFRGNLCVLGEGGASSKSPLRQTKKVWSCIQQAALPTKPGLVNGVSGCLVCCD